MARKLKLSASATFLKEFGSGVPYRNYSETDDVRLSDRIPNAMREILQSEGWCSYKNQVFWICDPDQWQVAANAWFPQSKNTQVLARTAFGDIFVWDGEMFWFVMVHDSIVSRTVDDSDWFFSRMLTAKDFALNSHLPGRVKAACKKSGPLEWDEMYTYVPALALGGSEASSQIKRVKAIEAIVFLAGLSPIRRV